MAPIQIDETADSLMESMREVQNSMAMLHSTVGELRNSMAETLKSMAEMKSALLLQPTTESQVPVDHQTLPEEAPTEQSKMVDNSLVDKDMSRYIYLKKTRIEMPVFDGHNLNSWIALAERYFKVGNFTEKEKLDILYLSVEGPALNWFNFCDNHEKPFLDWNDFKSRLIERFGGLRSAFERLLSLEQDESVIDYLCQFEELSTQCLDLSNDHLESLFVKGLKEEIQEMLRLFQPKGIHNIIAKARILENSSFCRLMNPPMDK
ncbi:hypothetical protein V5N11_032486 [Cardamine amara subsp. amara]|uniref:Retrotransposon gag domain-containing protein n=1 Tax=Cardamine amara subsp. amara TaxID=228776 RepID=A0ABD0Z2X6_CARAN